MNADIILGSLLLITLINAVRWFSALRALIYMMREAHPLLYQQVDGGGFFSSQGNMAKQMRLFHYLKVREYIHHHDTSFTQKCEKVRDTFILTSLFLIITICSAFFI